MPDLAHSKSLEIASVETICIRQPEFSPTTAWCTGATDALYDVGRSLRASSFGLYNAAIDHRSDPVFYVFVKITTTCGIEGLGGLGLGSTAMSNFINNQLAPLVLGRNAFDTELLWELMYRTTINVGRKGFAIEAISGIDIALWDIIGKALGQPVHNLLGGKTRDKIRCYASAGYPEADLDSVAQKAKNAIGQGFTAFKMRMGYGPEDGRKGMHANRDLVRAVRDAVGDDVDLMADAYMGWTPGYAIQMLYMLEEFGLYWLEEPVIADSIDGYREIRARSKTPIAGGEHEFTRWGFRQLIERGAVDIVQLDVNRVGGVTEARKVFALAGAFDLPVVPHSQNWHNLPLIAASIHAPLCEFFPGDVRDGDTFFGELFVGEPKAHDGYLTVSDQPGFGISLNADAIREFGVAV